MSQPDCEPVRSVKGVVPAGSGAGHTSVLTHSVCSHTAHADTDGPRPTPEPETRTEQTAADLVTRRTLQCPDGAGQPVRRSLFCDGNPARLPRDETRVPQSALHRGLIYKCSQSPQTHPLAGPAGALQRAGDGRCKAYTSPPTKCPTATVRNSPKKEVF